MRRVLAAIDVPCFVRVFRCGAKLLPGDQGLVPDDAIRPAPGITVLHVPSSFTHEQSGMRLTGRGVT